MASAKAQLATARQNLVGKEELHRQHVVGDFDLNKARNAKAEAEDALADAYYQSIHFFCYLFNSLDFLVLGIRLHHTII